MSNTTASRWSRVYRFATWILVGLFVVLTVAHVVLTVLFYTGVNDQGYGYVFDWEWPAWLIVIMDGSAAWMFWFAYRRCLDRRRLGLALTLAASTIAVSRALWMVFVPVLAAVTIIGSVGRLVQGQRRRSRA